MRFVATGGYRADVEAALHSGWQARNLYVSDAGRSVRVLLLRPHRDTRVITVEVPSCREVPSIVDLAPAMAWDEREAHDLHGIGFSGHRPLRPLIDHDAPIQNWTVPVRGQDVHQVAVGPVHAGIIESGHFRFHVVGDRILHVDPRLFYKTRGLEGAAEGAPMASGLAVISRSCAACSVANGLAYAIAAEQTLGLQPTSEMTRTRTLLLELERAWNHLNDIAAVCAGVGMAAGNMHFLALTERARRLNAGLTGHRFLAGSVRVGASIVTCDSEILGTAARELGEISDGAEVGWHALRFNTSFQDRLTGIGVVDAATVARLGVVGPAARAAGVAEDARSQSGLDYPGFEAVIPTEATGDVAARLEQRIIELRQTFRLLDRLLLSGPIRPAQAAATGGGPCGIGVGVVESARGATVCVVERSGDRVGRVRLRTGSYANWPAVAEAASGNLLPDFPLINKSFELCYACADR